MTVLFIYDFETPFRQAFMDLAIETGDKGLFRGAYASWVEWRSPSDVCGTEAFLEALGRVHSPDVIRAQSPFSGAVETLQDLADCGHDVMYISNRDEECLEATEDWLFGNGFPGGEVVCTTEDKQALMLHCGYLIDDRPKTICDFVYNRHWFIDKRKAFGLLYEYNRALTDIPNVWLAPTWGGLRYYLEKEDVLERAAT